nr:transposase [uncultured Oscillibacter sp.]
MNALFDLENGIYTDLIVQKEHEKNECRALCQMADRSRVSGKVILLADRNYESCNNLAHLEKRNWNYLIRIRDKARGIAYGMPLPDQLEFDIPLKLTLGRLTPRQLVAQGLAVPKSYLISPRPLPGLWTRLRAQPNTSSYARRKATTSPACGGRV